MPERWTIAKKSDIHVREALAVAVAMNSWRRQICGRFLYFIVDNKIVWTGLKNLTCKSPSVMRFIRWAALFAVQNQNRWFCHWLPSEDNAQADALSRDRIDDFLDLMDGFDTQETEAVFCDFEL